MEPNYFTCTLGQATSLGIQQPCKNVNKFLDSQAGKTPDSPAVAFPVPGQQRDDPWESLVFTFRDVQLGTQHVSNLLCENQGVGLEKRQTVGLLCPSTTEFLFTWLALMRLGHAVLLIAPQCQPTAIASLCKTCNTSLLFYDETYSKLATEASKTAPGEGSSLTAARLPFPDAVAKNTFVPAERKSSANAAVEVDENDVAYLHHTSGTSSGTPKPIPQPHRAAVGVLPSFEKGNEIATLTTTPLFHGGVADLFRAWTSGAMIWLFPGKQVPITASNIVKCLDVAKHCHEKDRIPPVKYFSSVPYVLQMMESGARGMQHLEDMNIVGVGGAALPGEVGDRLVEKDVNLISRFGSAECGFLMSSHRDYSKDKEWQYLRSDPRVECVSFEEQPDGLAELVIKRGWPHMAKQNREDGSFATADLLAPHPETPHAWRYHSRADSQLTLITGKKFDPAPLEGGIAASTNLVEDVLIFGNGQPFPGALLFRSASAKGLSDSDFMAELWPIVEKMNNESQDHAKLSKQMLVLMPRLEQPLEKSSKGTLLRGAAEKRFATTIDETYGKLNSVSGADVSDDELPPAIKEIIEGTLSKDAELTYDTNLFSYGVDSVAGMQIRSKLRSFLPKDAPQLPVNVVEDCGTVFRMAEYIKGARRGQQDEIKGEAADDHRLMLELVDEHSKFEDSQQAGTTPDITPLQTDGKEVILLTGATGALGAHVIDQYRRHPSVSTIYCLVRAPTPSAARSRLSTALTDRHLPPLDHPTTTATIHALPSDLSNPTLGLPTHTYTDLAATVTTILHLAWSVNFRLHLRSFATQNLPSLPNLLNLALAAPGPKPPPRFTFCSSVASALAHPSNLIPETLLPNPAAATRLGYSQSKWVAEQLCARADALTRLRGRVTVLRVGQVGGDGATGVWNTREAWPRLLGTWRATGGRLPDLGGERLDWLPVDVAARGMVEGGWAGGEDGGKGDGEELEKWNGEGVRVLHVVNWREGTAWRTMLGWVREWDGVEGVSPARWVELLEGVAARGEEHAALQLLDHWKQAYLGEGGDGAGEDGASDGEPRTFAMERSKAAMPSLRGVKPVDQAYFAKLWDWVKREM